MSSRSRPFPSTFNYSNNNNNNNIYNSSNSIYSSSNSTSSNNGSRGQASVLQSPYRWIIALFIVSFLVGTVLTFSMINETSATSATIAAAAAAAGGAVAIPSATIHLPTISTTTTTTSTGSSSSSLSPDILTHISSSSSSSSVSSSLSVNTPKNSNENQKQKEGEVEGTAATSALRGAGTSNSNTNSNSNSKSSNSDAPSRQVDSKVAKLTAKPLLDKIESLFNFGLIDPEGLLNLLLNNDIFSTKRGVDNFTCSDTDIADGLLEYPEVSFNQSRLEDFRRNAPGSFLFYQHLRKAGGTGFCDLARSNMMRRQTPGYYCMPDNKGSLATPPWNQPNYLLKDIQEHEYRIVANEWDVFLTKFLNYPGAIFGTTIRDPIDRWYSQYRFEHLEHRDGSGADAPRNPFIKWYNNNKNWFMGANYYVKTFIGKEDTDFSRTEDFYWTYHKYSPKRYTLTWADMKAAIRNIQKFQLILVLDWISTETTSKYLIDVMDWHKSPKQVLPHESQATRADKHSLKAQDVMQPADLLFIRKENVFDLLFFEVTKRIVLERLHCY